MVEFGSQIEILDESFFFFKFLEREYFRGVEFVFGIWKNELNKVNLGVKGLYRCPKLRQKYIAQGLINQEKTQISLKLPTTPPTDRGWINYPPSHLWPMVRNFFLDLRLLDHGVWSHLPSVGHTVVHGLDKFLVALCTDPFTARGSTHNPWLGPRGWHL